MHSWLNIIKRQSLAESALLTDFRQLDKQKEEQFNKLLVKSATISNSWEELLSYLETYIKERKFEDEWIVNNFLYKKLRIILL